MSDPLETIATMPGPLFALLYAGALALVLLTCRVALRGLDTTSPDPPAIPSEPDAFEVAYLRGGARELIGLVTIGLVERGYLRMTDHETAHVVRVTTGPARDLLTPIEAAVFDSFAAGRTAGHTSGLDTLHENVDALSAAAYRERLENEHLLTPDEAQSVASAVAVAVLVAFGALAAYWIAMTGLARIPVSFLVLGAAGTYSAAFGVCRLPRPSRRGRAYLERLRNAYANVRLPSLPPPLGQPTPSLVLLVGIFGTAVLAETAYAHHAKLFPKPAGGGWSFGTSADADDGGDAGDGGDGGD